MKHNRYNRIAAVFGFMLVAMIGGALVGQGVFAQSAGTLGAEQGGQRLTQAAAELNEARTQAAATVQNARTQVRGTVQGAQIVGGETVQAVQTNVRSTADAARAQVNATVDAYTTDVVATVEGLRTEVVATLQGVAQEIDAQLNVLDFEFDAAARTLTLTTAIDENQINEAVEAALVAAGYGEIAATVDLVPDGMIITLDNVTLENGQTATATLTLTLVESDGTYTLAVTDVMVGGATVPAGQFDEVLQAYVESYMEDILNGSTSDFQSELPEGTVAVNADVDSVLITDDLIVVIVVIALGT